MLNEAPKKPKKVVDYAHPNGWQLFWRIQRESWRRMLTPALMYFFMSLMMLAVQVIEIVWLQIVLGVACIAGGIFFNAHLMFHFGDAHYDTFLSGRLYRKREQEEGIFTAPDHHVEKEYRPWKGFFIGFLIGLPVILLGILSGALEGTTAGNAMLWAFAMLAGCAIVPITWLRNYVSGLAGLSYFWTIPTVIVPIVVSGVFYMLGAWNNQRKRTRREEREAAIKAAAEAAREERLHHVQTEEQRKKTLQTKKKR